MLEKINTSVIFYAHYIASKVGATGLTVTVDVWEITRAGVATEIVTAGSATEIGDGLYRYLLAAGSVDAAAEYIAVFKTADTSVDTQHLPAIWVIQRAGIENLDATITSRSDLDVTDILSDSTAFAGTNIAAILADSGELQTDWTDGGRLDLILDAILVDTGTTLPCTLASIQAKTDRIGTGTAVLIAPVKANGDVDITRGDSYLNADSRALDWTDTTWSLAATSAFIVIVQDVCVFTGSRVSATQARLELTSAQSLTLPEGVCDFTLQEVQAGGERISRLQGVWTVETRPYPTS